MKKEILIKEVPFLDDSVISLVADDVNAYELVFKGENDFAGCTFEITAIRADGQTVTDVGEIYGNTLKYLLKNSMYAVPGKLEIRIRVVSKDQSVLTAKILNFNVIEGGITEDAVTAVDNYPVLTKLVIDTKNVLERAEAVTEVVEGIVKNIPVVVKNENTIVTKDGNHTVAKDCNNGLVVGKENTYNEGDYSVIFGVDNEVTGHSNVVSGSHNVVKGLHNLVVGNKLKVDDDGTAQVIFGLGENVPVSKDVAIGYYNLGKKTFEVLKDGTLTLNDQKIASLPECEPLGGDFILECNTTNKNYDIGFLKTRGGVQNYYRLVVAKSEIPEISKNWIGHTIEWKHIYDNGSFLLQKAIIRNISQRTDNQDQYNIDFDKAITHFESDDDARKYWSSFTIKGSYYGWKPKTEMFEDIKKYLNI